MIASESEQLLELATDLSRGDAELIEALKRAIASPPYSPEVTGYYGMEKQSEIYRCFATMVTLLRRGHFCSGAEDKYIYEILLQWKRPGRLEYIPERFDRMFDFDNYSDEIRPAFFAEMKRDYVKATQDLEAAFEATGFPLMSFTQPQGDTICFINVEPRVRRKWLDVSIGQTAEGQPLALTPPPWARFWEHMDYSLSLGFVPDGLMEPRAASAAPPPKTDFTRVLRRHLLEKDRE